LKIVQFQKSLQIRKTKKMKNEKQKPETDENRASTKKGLNLTGIF
jgi:hypothetical protein